MNNPQNQQNPQIQNSQNDSTISSESSQNSSSETISEVVSIRSEKKWLSLITVLVVIILLGISVFMGFRLLEMDKKIQSLETLTSKSSRQLTNLDQILGHSLESTKSQDGTLSPIEVKLTLGIFHRVNELLIDVSELHFMSAQSFENIASSPPSNIGTEPLKKSANAEMRWWGQIFNQFLIPLKKYFTSLVKVQVVDTPVNELAMTRGSQLLLKKEITLRLLTIRQLVLNGLIPESVSEVEELHSQVAKNMDIDSANVKVFLGKLEQLKQDLDLIQQGSEPVQTP